MPRTANTRRQHAISAKLDELTMNYLEMMPSRYNRNRLLNRAIELLYWLKADYRCGNFTRKDCHNARVWNLITEGCDDETNR